METNALQKVLFGKKCISEPVQVLYQKIRVTSKKTFFEAPAMPASKIGRSHRTRLPSFCERKHEYQTSGTKLCSSRLQKKWRQRKR